MLCMCMPLIGLGCSKCQEHMTGLCRHPQIVQLLQDIKFNVHSHPTLSEVLDELFKQGHLEKMDRPDAKPAVAQKMPQQARI